MSPVSRRRSNHGLKIPLRPPAKFPARQRIVVDAIDAREHSPAALSIFAFPTRRAKADDSGRVDAEACAILGQERRRRADDVFAEADSRRALGGEEMGFDDVLDRDAAKQVFVRLQVVVGVGNARFRIVVLLRKEARGPQHDRRQTLIAMEQLAEVLGRGFGDAVNVLRHVARRSRRSRRPARPSGASARRRRRSSCWS